MDEQSASSPSIDKLIASLRKEGVVLRIVGGRLTVRGGSVPVTAARTAKILAREREIIEFLQRFKARSRRTVMRAHRSQSRYPLSFVQERLYFLQLLWPSSSAYNIPLTYMLAGSLQLPLLERALAQVIGRHEILHSRFVLDEQGPHQELLPASVPLQVIGLMADGEAQHHEMLLTLRERDATTAFDLANEPPLRIKLVRLSDTRYCLMITIHHIAFDGTSSEILLRDLCASYRALERGEANPLPPVAVQYRDFANWQREQWAEAAGSESYAYWRKRLEGAPVALPLPAKQRQLATAPDAGGLVRFALDEDALLRLRRFASSRHTTLFMVLAAVFQVGLFRWTGCEDSLLGFSMTDRPEGTAGLIGPFINMLVLRTELRGECSFEDVLSQVRERVLEADAHHEVPFEKLVEIITPGGARSEEAGVQVTLNHQFPGPDVYAMGSVSVNEWAIHPRTVRFDLTLNWKETDTALEGVIEFSRARFDPESIERLGARLINLLDALPELADKPISLLPWLDRGEQTRLSDLGTGPVAELPNLLAHEAFAEWASRAPDAIALVSPEGDISYGDLNERADRLSQTLREMGVGPEVPVGLCARRSHALIVAMIAIQRAGGTYVPIDPSNPESRIRHIVETAGLKLLLTQKACCPAMEGLSARRVLLDGCEDVTGEVTANANAVQITPEMAAYIIFTSGSTGKPKGVVVPYRGIANLYRAYADRYNLRPGKRALVATSHAFDLAIKNIWVPLTVGATVVLAPDGVLGGADMLDYIERTGTTMAAFVPSQFYEFATAVLECGRTPKALECIRLSGECTRSKPVADLLRSSSSLRFANGYGTTEITDVCTEADIVKAEGTTITDLGRPIPNTRLLALDSSLQLVPTNTVGELYVAGIGVARGYCGQPGLTASRFVADPSGKGERMYRTGDLVKWTANGTLEFCGRTDDQVKIRGFRVEPREVETELSHVPGVESVFVAARTDRHGELRLVAYLTASAPLEAADLRTVLKQALPSHLIPDAFVFLERIPVTANGKVDRRALPPPEDYVAKAPYVPPATQVQRQLSAILSEVLLVKDVGLEDNFFDLGGNSIDCMKIVAQARKAGLRLTVRDVFDGQTVAGIAAASATASASVRGSFRISLK